MEASSLKFNPVLLFCYRRIDVLKETVQYLLKNKGAEETDVYIFSDGPKSSADLNVIEELRVYLRSIAGFKSVTIYESEANKGLARSIIDGISRIFENYNSVIVLEDDLITSSNFLLYMNQCLARYKNNPKVFSISGYSPPSVKGTNDFDDVYFFPRNSSHGWATWKNRWKSIDWNISDFKSFIQDKGKRAEFNNGGSDLTQMLKRQMDGQINSWSIRLCYHQYKTKTFTVYPTISKIQNIGFGAGATHTNNYNRFHTWLDPGSKLNFTLPENVVVGMKYYRQFQEFYSIKQRGLGRAKTFLYRIGLLKNR
jgi:hypothetical protein